MVEAQVGPEKLTKAASNYLISSAERTAKKQLTPAQKELLSNFVEASTHGAAASAPMICKGAGCAFLSACPLAQAQIPLPVTKPCPAERSMVQIWVNKHLDNLGIKDPLAADNSFDMDLLYEIAHMELIRWRATVHLSDDSAMIEEKQIAATPQGEGIFADIIHPALDILERAGKQVQKLRDALLATRKAQIQAGQQMGDPSVKAASLVERARKVNRKRRELQEAKDAEFEVLDE